jgi:1,4-alpha-glucan branching enzyme
MPASQQHIGPGTPMGANLVGGGATFRVWAPAAKQVFVSGVFNGFAHGEPERLVRGDDGYWAGFVPGVKDGGQYKFWVVGPAASGFKRDPYARELSDSPPYPHCNCVVRDPGSYTWHDQGFRPPGFSDLVLYQLHVGTFFGADRAGGHARFLDVLGRLEYLIDLGVNAVQLLPVSEYAVSPGQGYDGSDLFSPEMAYAVPPTELAGYLPRINALLARAHRPPLTNDEARRLQAPVNQLKTLIDLFHLNGMSVLFDLILSHAGAELRDPSQNEGLWFFDLEQPGDPSRSQYFTDQDNAGPVFALWKREVRQFLVDNASFYAQEYHVDGFRYDTAFVIVQSSPDGWPFCQSLTNTVRFLKPEAIQVAEYWPDNAAAVSAPPGAGFDAAWHDGVRESVRAALGQAAGGGGARVDLDTVARNVYPPGWPAGWKAVQYLESHDEVLVGRSPRVAALADPADPHSWYGRSRARVAAGLLLTAPGIPMLFMGQELLAAAPWSDNPGFFKDTLVRWEDFDNAVPAVVDYHRVVQALIGLRREFPALRGPNPPNVFHVHDGNRVIAYQRWLEGFGGDVVVAATLSETTYFGYQLGFPGPGRWREVFNSDAFDFQTPHPSGNGGSVLADGPGMHGLPASAPVVIPANGVVVFAR